MVKEIPLSKNKALKKARAEREKARSKDPAFGKVYEPRLKIFDEMHMFPEEEQTPPPESPPKVLNIFTTLSPLAGLYMVTDEGNFWRRAEREKIIQWYKEVEPNVFVMLPDNVTSLYRAMRSFYAYKTWERNQQANLRPHFTGLNVRKKHNMDEFMRLVMEEKMSVLAAGRKLGIDQNMAYKYHRANRNTYFERKAAEATGQTAEQDTTHED